MFSTKRCDFRWNKEGILSLVTVDVGRRLSMFVVFISCCSIMDYLFTLRHLAAGLRELNPVMAYLFELGWQEAFLFKYLMTAAGLFLLCSASSRSKTGWLVVSVAWIYGVLTVYHLFLLKVA
ncbi:MAG: DUF5658 family protein [Pseudomonadota bacterium]